MREKFVSVYSGGINIKDAFNRVFMMSTILKFFSPEFVKKIPNRLVEIPERVYQKTGIVVNFRKMTEQDMGSPIINAPPAAAAISGADHSITILVRSDIIEPSHIAHELIHLRRYALEEIPMLWPNEYATQSDVPFILNVDNQIEHLYVVPEEINAVPSSKEWWQGEYKELLSTHRDAFRLTMHLLFLTIVLPSNINLLEQCRSLLLELSEENLHQAQVFASKVVEAMPEKNDVIALFREMLHPQLRPRLTTARYNIKDKRVSIMPVMLA